jgi:hypothetical protein
VIVWVLDTALDAASGVVTAGFVVVVGGDVATKRQGSGCEKRGWGDSRGGLGRPGSVCRRSRGAGSCFGAGGEVVVVVVNVVGVVDGGCACVVSGDVAASREVSGCVSRVCVDVSVVLGVDWVLKSTCVVVCAFFSELGSSSSSGSVCRAAYRRSGLSLVWEAVSSVAGVAWDVTSTVAGAGVVWVLALQVVIASVWVLELVVALAASLCFISQVSRSAVLPHSSPSFLPSFLPSSNASFRAFSSSSLLNVSKTLFCSSSLAKNLPSSYPSSYPSFFPSSKALAFAFSISSSITVRSMSLCTIADDFAVVGLQNRPISGMVSSVGSVAVLAFRAEVLDAVVTALAAAMFAFKSNVFSREFFFWLRLPCPGPGMLGIGTEKKANRLVLGSGTGSVIL